ncbi:MAG: hypothetical protein NTV51_09525 [Verrucomicrobia bacterium]|nr:hypothetical protein [Verrucomicrobiota bacterium]
MSEPRHRWRSVFIGGAGLRVSQICGFLLQKSSNMLIKETFSRALFFELQLVSSPILSMVLVVRAKTGQTIAAMVASRNDH